MKLFCRAKSILAPAIAIGSSPFRTLTLVTSVGLLVGYGSVASATTSPAVPIIQEHDEQEDHDVKLHKHHSDSDGEIKIVVVKDGDLIHQELVKKLKSEHQGQLHKIAAGADGNVEVVVIQDRDSKDHRGMLGKLKSDLKGQLHEIILEAAGDNVEVIVVDDTDTKHHALLKKLIATENGHLHKLHANSDGDHNVFVLQDDEEHDTKMDLHEHLIELLHGQESNELNHAALARKLRQLADRLESKHNRPHSAHESKGNVEIQTGDVHKFHIEKRGDSEKANNQEFEFTTDAGKHIVIVKPDQTGTMVIDLRPASGGKLHSHDGDHKTIVLHGKEHDADHNVFVEEIHLDEDHSPSDVTKKVLDRLKLIPKHNVVIEEIHKDGAHNTHAHESHAAAGQTSEEGLDASIRDLKNELEELRRELKELQSDRRDRKKD